MQCLRANCGSIGARRQTHTRNTICHCRKIPQCATLVMAPTAQDRTRGYHQTDCGRARLSCQQNTGRNDIGSTTRTCGSNTRRSGDSRFFRAYHFPPHKKASGSDKGSGNDSIWAFIGSWAKYLQLNPDTILYDISHANLLLYGRCVAGYGDTNNDKSKDSHTDKPTDYSNPDNFTNAPKRTRI